MLGEVFRGQDNGLGVGVVEPNFHHRNSGLTRRPLVEIARIEALFLREALSLTHAQVLHAQLAFLLHHRGGRVVLPGGSPFLAKLLLLLLLLESEGEWEACRIDVDEAASLLRALRNCGLVTGCHAASPCHQLFLTQLKRGQRALLLLVNIRGVSLFLDPDLAFCREQVRVGLIRRCRSEVAPIGKLVVLTGDPTDVLLVASNLMVASSALIASPDTTASSLPPLREGIGTVI